MVKIDRHAIQIDAYAFRYSYAHLPTQSLAKAGQRSVIFGKRNYCGSPDTAPSFSALVFGARCATWLSKRRHGDIAPVSARVISDNVWELSLVLTPSLTKLNTTARDREPQTSGIYSNISNMENIVLLASRIPFSPEAKIFGFYCPRSILESEINFCVWRINHDRSSPLIREHMEKGTGEEKDAIYSAWVQFINPGSRSRIIICTGNQLPICRLLEYWVLASLISGTHLCSSAFGYNIHLPSAPFWYRVAPVLALGFIYVYLLIVQIHDIFAAYTVHYKGLKAISHIVFISSVLSFFGVAFKLKISTLVVTVLPHVINLSMLLHWIIHCYGGRQRLVFCLIDVVKNPVEKADLNEDGIDISSKEAGMEILQKYWTNMDSIWNQDSRGAQREERIDMDTHSAVTGDISSDRLFPRRESWGLRGCMEGRIRTCRRTDRTIMYPSYRDLFEGKDESWWPV
ncbi:hypothetical protein EDC01DRAFT_298339 [Geopyxis carbonaria]|nr:hypothetical protein EDC01DRAFT_298339 [Geopyxis carbonaria]